MGFSSPETEKGDVLASPQDHSALSYVSAVDDADNERAPTEEELRTLRFTPGPMSWVSILVCFVEFAERASYYGCSRVFDNFIMRPLPPGSRTGAIVSGATGKEQNAGALDMGTARATAINMTFQFLSFTIPLLSGYFSDTRWGRYKTITYGLLIGAVSHALLIIPAIPQVLEKIDAARALFILSVLLLAFATGFIKPSLNPLLCDQNPVKRQYVKRLPSGELVIVDPTTTLQGYQLMFYQCISYGSVFGLATTYSARRVGFWLAFGLPGILYVIMCFLLRFLGPRLVKVPPKPGVVGELFAVFKRVLSNGGLRKLFSRKPEDIDEFWNKAKPSAIASRGDDVSRVTWDDQFVDEARTTVNCLKVFLFTLVYAFVGGGGLGTQQNAQGGVLKKDGLPNDLLANFQPIATIIFAPILNFLILPTLRRFRIPSGACYRIIAGFICGATSMAIGAIIQWKVYTTSECGYYASTCETSTNISLWWQTPMYMLPGIGELLVITTAYEIAYTRAPARMKGLVYASLLFSFAGSYIIVLIASPFIVDPNLIWPFVAGSCAAMLSAVCLFIWFRSLNEPIKDLHYERMGVEPKQEDVKAQA